MTVIDSQLQFIQDNIRIYDNPNYRDRYTAVFIHKPCFKSKKFDCLGMSEHPFHPQGVGQMTSGQDGEHLGRRITFQDLPQDCQRLLVRRVFDN